MVSAAWIAYTVRTEFPFEPVLAFAACFAVWIATELKAEAQATDKQMLHPHDIRLAFVLRDIFTDRLVERLKNQDFGNSFDMSELDGIYDITRWDGPKYEFEDELLAQKLKPIIAMSKRIRERVTEKAMPVEGTKRETWSFASEEERMSDFHNSSTTAIVSGMNQDTTRLYNLVVDFERTFRKLSPESYAPGAAPGHAVYK